MKPSTVHGKRYAAASIILAISAIISLSSCPSSSSPAVNKASAPEISPPEGSYPATGFVVRLSSATAGAELRYTTDGSTPDASSRLYDKNAGLALAASATVRAVAIKSGLDQSDATTAAYTLADGGKTVHGRVLYGDSPMPEIVPGLPVINGYQEGDYLTSITSFYDLATGYYAVTGFPATGALSLSFTFFASGRTHTSINYNLAGNYRAAYPNYPDTTKIDAATFDSTQSFDCQAYALIRMSSPADNLEPIAEADARGSHASPLAFAWDPVPKATVYKYYVESYSASDAWKDRPIALTSTPDTTLTLNLPALSTGEYYRFYIDAYDKDQKIAGIFYRTCLKGTDSWTISPFYEFTVSSARAAASAPVFSPAPGAVPAGAPLVVTLSCATPGEIRYTTDGTTPTATSLLYDATAKIPISAATTISAAAFPTDPALAPSNVASGEYSFTSSGVRFSGKVRFNGADISAVTSVEPSIYAYDSESYVDVDSLASYYDAASSSYFVAGMPSTGAYVLVVKFGHNLTLGGEFTSSSAIADIAAVGSTLDLAATQAIHMTSPRDNATAFNYTHSSGGPADVSSYDASPTVSWEAVPGAKKYRFYLFLAADDGSGDQPFLGNYEADAPTTSTELDLSPSDATHHYILSSFYAYADAACTIEIGRYSNVTMNTIGSSLSFKVN
jgi:hypothetical protein